MPVSAMPAATAVMSRWLRGSRPAVIFDFNGTLSDDEPILFGIFAELFDTRLGWSMTQAEYRDELLGLSDREIVQRAVNRCGADTEVIVELLAMRHSLYADRVAAQNPITDSTVALVKALADNEIPLAIVTGAQRADVLAVLRASPIGQIFDVTITEEDVSRGEPDPEGFLAAAAALAREPSDILVFEDSVPGVRGALAAGMSCIAVSADPAPELRSVAPAIVPALSADLLTAARDGLR